MGSVSTVGQRCSTRCMQNRTSNNRRCTWLHAKLTVLQAAAPGAAYSQPRCSHQHVFQTAKSTCCSLTASQEADCCSNTAYAL